MLTDLRVRVTAALQGVPARRRPALRRCDAADALLSTDLPLIAEPEAVRSFTEAMAAQGFCVLPRSGWLLLDAPVPPPDAPVPDDLAGEAGCCISLLLRHPGAGEAEAAIRALVKAAEAGKQPFDRLCGQLHADFARKLRTHEPLPGALLPYLCAAYRKYAADMP